MMKEINISVKVFDIVETPLQKTAVRDAVFMELDWFWESVIESLPKDVFIFVPRWYWYSANIREYVTEFIFSAAQPRHKTYLSFDTDGVKADLVAWASKILYTLQFDELQASLRIASVMDNYGMLSMLFSMMSTIIIATLVCLSGLLLYSLLQISVDTRVFEIGVLRMIGFNKVNTVGLIFVQALTYSVPGLLFGIGGAFGLNTVVIRALVETSHIPLSSMLSVKAILITAAVAFGLTLLSVFFPIRSALSQNLHDAIDRNHSKSKVIHVTIERSEDYEKPWMAVFSGILFTVVGGLVYLIMPDALLSLDFPRISIIFFLLLFITLLGVIALLMNLEYLFEKALATIFLFWESSAVRSLALTNLGSHRLRNRKTSLLFSGALSFVIFLSIAFSEVLSGFRTTTYMEHGTDLHLRATKDYVRADSKAAYIVHPEELEAITDKYPDVVQNVAWVTHDFETLYSEPVKTQISNRGRSHSFYLDMYGVTPNFMDAINQTYIQITDSWTGGGANIIRDLYTGQSDRETATPSIASDWKGSGEGVRTMLPDSFREMMGAKAGDSFEPRVLSLLPFEKKAIPILDKNSKHYLEELGKALYQQLIEILYNSNSYISYSNAVSSFNVTATGYAKQFPFFSYGFEPMKFGNYIRAPFSIPSFLSILGKEKGTTSFDNLKFNQVFITYKLNATQERKIELLNELKMFRCDPSDPSSKLSIWEYDDFKGTMNSTMSMVNLILMGITVLVMVLCFFSLMASMHTNVMEQHKEVGILRGIGLSRFQLARVYAEEAFILVVTAAFIGIVTGLFVGCVIAYQFAVIQFLPVQVTFPFPLVGLILLLSVVLAVLSVIAPLCRLLKKSIVSTIRTS